MAVRFIVGRSGSGKSQHILDEIRTQLNGNPEGDPLVLLVPEQATFQAELALVSTPGLSGIIRAQVLSFHRLAFRIMQEVGGTNRILIDDLGKKMLLNQIVYKLKDQLSLFQHTAGQSGLFDSLHTLFNEFKRYCLTPAVLQTHFETKAHHIYQGTTMTAEKLRDLMLIYNAYEEELSRRYVESEDYLSILAGQLPLSHFSRQAQIWIDGFHGFTPQEFQVVEQLMLHCSRVTVALSLDQEYGSLDQPEELDLFHPTAMTMIRLQEAAIRLKVKVEPSIVKGSTAEPGSTRYHSRQLTFLEANFGQKRVWPAEGWENNDLQPSDITVQSAVHRRAEVEGAAREMVRLVRDEGYRWRDIAVMIREEEVYGDLLSTILTDYQIPYFMDRRKSVLHHPLVEFIRSALEVALHNWQYDAVFRCVKTDFLFPIFASDTEEQAYRKQLAQLENYVLAFGIMGSRWTDGFPWKYRLNVSLDEDEQLRQSVDENNKLDEINASRQMIVQPLSSLQRSLQRSKTVDEMLAALYQLLEDVGAASRIELWSDRCIQEGYGEKAREHTQLWENIMILIDQMSEIMGRDELSLELFAEMIETGLASIKLAHVPPSLDQVLVGHLDRTRSSRIKVFFILGINDGVLPSRIKENGILTEQEREQLSDSGLELAPGSRRKLLDEQFLIYTALTAPSDRLWLSYSLADEEGKSLLPSELIRRVREMFPQIQHTCITMDPPVAAHEEALLPFIVHPAKVLSYLSVQFRHWTQGDPISDVWWEAYNWLCSAERWQEPLRNLARSLRYTNRESSIGSSTSLQLYGDPLQASVSRMERFVACPFAHFASHGLRLRERRTYRLDAPDIGQLFHAALSVVGQQLLQEGLQWGQLTAEQCRARATAAVDLLKPRLQSEILFSSKRFRYIARKLEDILGRSAVIIGEHAQRSSFTPVGLELGFGAHQQLPPLTLPLLNGHTMDIVGRIDRIDLARNDQDAFLRIIDYKSSQTSLHLSEVFYGLSLQVLTYLDVALTHAERWLGHKARPAGVLYFHVHNPLLQSKSRLTKDDAEQQLFRRYKMRGLLLEEPTVIQLMDDRLEQGHSTLLPVAIKSDGSFYKQSSVATDQQWSMLQDYVRGSIQRIGEGIISGDVDIHPYRSGSKSACTFCSFKPVCQFDNQLEGNEFKLMRPLTKAEAWERMEEKELHGQQVDG